MNEVVGPLDPEHLEETLNTVLREGGAVHLDPFFRACQQWRESFEEKGVMIIIENVKMLHATQENVNKMVAILKQDFSIIDELRAWSQDLQTLKAIKGQRSRTLVDVYTMAELDMIDDWIEKIADSNKVMETLHEEIHRLKEKAQGKIFEAERHYSDACLDIFEDDEHERLLPIDTVVENFKNIFLEVDDKEDIRQAFKTEEALLELDTKLGDFADTRIEVDNYKCKVKDKYEALDLPDATKITEAIEKFKGKHPNIPLG